MTTMSDDGERTCPLCAEDMDLTDQQLKPCKCGYEICVWCWHHIMDMAEKDDTEGRCPACRTPYDKEKIVGMAANCERMVAEINAEKKHKSQKAKLKTSAEARKHLTSVRVIQRNLVYIIGLPSNICDESILERKEYFGQYGKVLKVSISRPAVGANQQPSNNNTFSVYITYAREEEAVRCIQAVHNFVLEGKALRACFGTTKYCHAWLRNMTCSNPDCLYLHDIGSQEDSFTKDEIISAYTRVPQIASNNSQRRSGGVLPPPADDLSSSVAVSNKHVVKSSNIYPQNASVQLKGSPPNNNAGKSTVLPAAASWGLRSSNCRPVAASLPCSQAPVKQKAETISCSPSLSAMVATIKHSSAWHDDDVVMTSKFPGRQIVHVSDKSIASEPSKPVVGKDCQPALLSGALLDSDCNSRPSAWNDDEDIMPKVCEEKHMVDIDDRSSPSEALRPVVDGECPTSGSVFVPEDVPNIAHTSQMSTSCLPSLLPSPAGDRGRSIALIENNADQLNSHSFNFDDRRSTSADEVTEGCGSVNGNIESLCKGLTSVNMDSHSKFDQLDIGQHQTLVSDSQVLNEISDWRSEREKQGLTSTRNEIEDALAANDNLRFRHSDVIDHSSSSHYLNQSRSHADYSSSWNCDTRNKYSTFAGGYQTLDTKLDTALPQSRENEFMLFNGHKDDDVSSFSKPGKVFEYPEMNCTEENAKCIGRFDDVANFDKTATVDMGESSIISNILSLDFDPWDDSSSSANNFSKLLGETKKQDGSFKLSSSWKSPNCSQSRFSFARQESQPSFVEPSTGDSGYVHKLCLPTQNSFGDGFQNRLVANNCEVPNATTSTNTVISSERLAGVSRSKISAPPGFSTPSRAPPPGFSTQDRFNQAYETTYTDSHLLNSPSLGNHNQAHLIGSSADVEFIDPAILAVGKGRIPLGVNNSGPSLKPTFPTQFSNSDGDPRLQLLMQQSISPHQNIRVPDHIGDRFFPVNDSFIASRLLAQNHGSLSPFAEMSRQQPRNSYLSSNQWDAWNDVRTSSDMGMRFGLNNYYGSNEEHKFHMPNSGDIYNRAFGI